MIREYQLREEGSNNWATITRGDLYIEVPHSADETVVQDKIDYSLMSVALENFKESQVRDDVYVNGSIVRQDHTVGSTEGLEILDELQAAFPDYRIFDRSQYNIIGKYDGYREPYANLSISWYDFEVKPSESLLLAFNTSYPISNLKNWYGLKFDLVTSEVLLKVVIKEYNEDHPLLPTGETFYAVTHAQDGSSSDWIDAYVYATPKRIREFCADNGLSYPLPPSTHTECDVVWCWGFVFNKQTMEYGAVKAYARYNVT